MTHAPEREDIKCPIAGGAPDCIKKTQIRNLRQEFLNSLSFLLSMLFRFLIVDESDSDGLRQVMRHNNIIPRHWIWTIPHPGYFQAGAFGVKSKVCPYVYYKSLKENFSLFCEKSC